MHAVNNLLQRKALTLEILQARAHVVDRQLDGMLVHDYETCATNITVTVAPGVTCFDPDGTGISIELLNPCLHKLGFGLLKIASDFLVLKSSPSGTLFLISRKQ